jgi:hypothetical protein
MVEAAGFLSSLHKSAFFEGKTAANWPDSTDQRGLARQADVIRNDKEQKENEMMNPQNNKMTVEDAANVLEAQLTDLELTDDELDGIKGGTRTGADDGGGGRSGGDWIINHNEMILRDE